MEQPPVGGCLTHPCIHAKLHAHSFSYAPLASWPSVSVAILHWQASRAAGFDSPGWTCGQGVDLPQGVQYIPMIPAAQYATASAIKAIQAINSGVLLGYNEPDIPNQGNTTVAVLS